MWLLLSPVAALLLVVAVAARRDDVARQAAKSSRAVGAGHAAVGSESRPTKERGHP
ncbi:MAG: hypothetical protein WC718_10030 [Phycisphaerales bacterium]|jgi:hypothetical protein